MTFHRSLLQCLHTHCLEICDLHCLEICDLHCFIKLVLSPWKLGQGHPWHDILKDPTIIIVTMYIHPWSGYVTYIVLGYMWPTLFCQNIPVTLKTWAGLSDIFIRCTWYEYDDHICIFYGGMCLLQLFADRWMDGGMDNNGLKPGLKPRNYLYS